MQTLLRHTITNLYVQGPDKWTDNPNRACDFRFIDRAIQYAETLGLTEVELAFTFDDLEQVKTLPLKKAAEHCAAVA